MRLNTREGQFTHDNESKAGQTTMRNPVNLELNLCGRATTPRGDGKKIGRSVTMAVDAASMRCEITSVSLCEYIYRIRRSLSGNAERREAGCVMKDDVTRRDVGVSPWSGWEQQQHQLPPVWFASIQLLKCPAQGSESYHTPLPSPFPLPITTCHDLPTYDCYSFLKSRQINVLNDLERIWL